MSHTASQSLIHLLGWLESSETLCETFDRADQKARDTNQSEIKTEHLLAALLEKDVDAADYVAEHSQTAGARKLILDFCEALIRGDAAGERTNPQTATHQSAAGQSAGGVWGSASQQTAAADVYASRSAYGSTTPSTSTYGSSLSARDNDPYDSSLSHSTAGYDPSPSAAGWGASATPSSSTWAAPSTSSYAATSASRHSAASIVSGSTAGQAAVAVTTDHPKPSRAVRRILARATMMAETEGAGTLTSQFVMQAIAADSQTSCGEQLRAFLSAAAIADVERLMLGTEGAFAVSEATQLSDELRQAKHTIGRLEANLQADDRRPVFDVVIDRIEDLKIRLDNELRDDRWHWLANDMPSSIGNDSVGMIPEEERARLEALSGPFAIYAKRKLEQDPRYQAVRELGRVRDEIVRQQETLGWRLRNIERDRDDRDRLVHLINELMVLPEDPPVEALSFDGPTDDDFQTDTTLSAPESPSGDRDSADLPTFAAIEAAAIRNLELDDALRGAEVFTRPVTEERVPSKLEQSERGRPKARSFLGRFFRGATTAAPSAEQFDVDVGPDLEQTAARDQHNGMNGPTSDKAPTLKPNDDEAAHGDAAEQDVGKAGDDGNAGTPIILLSDQTAAANTSGYVNGEVQDDEELPAKLHRRPGSVTTHLVWGAALISATVALGVIVHAAVAAAG
ncbi:MAG: hypothetical protein AAGC70_12245 [Pseudomonadota bacterium]